MKQLYYSLTISPQREFLFILWSTVTKHIKDFLRFFCYTLYQMQENRAEDSLVDGFLASNNNNRLLSITGYYPGDLH